MATASRSTKRIFLTALLAVAVAAGGAAAYFGKDSLLGKATPEKSAGKGPVKPPPSVPVMVASVVQQTLPVQVQGIGNVEAYTTVAVKARIDGQILEVKFQEGK